MNPPTSFKTNVNRAKTKRWVEAKSYSYDGDDWGDADDYDEYNGYDEPTPPARPTGFRQPGQAVDSSSYTTQGGSADREGGRDYRRSDYGDLSAHSPGPWKQDGARSATNPIAPSAFSRDRVNSFDRNDEKRSFSAGGMPSSYATGYAVTDPTTMQCERDQHQPSTPFAQMGFGVPPGAMSAVDSQWHQSARQGNAVAAPLQVQTHFPTYSDRPATDQISSPVNVSQTPVHHEPPRQPNPGSRTHSMTSNTPSTDLQHRRDFSPSALPPPLHPRASPAPKSANDDSPGMRFPPRKSSLSQQSSPYIPNPVANTQAPYLSHDESNSAEVAQAEAVPSFRDRAGSNTAKPLPFVRPADIYKRMEEERERARRSQESGRPSMDSITGRSAGDAVSATESAKNVLLSDNQGKGVRRKSSLEGTDGDEVNRRLKPVLDPVAERKSEYGLEGFHGNVQRLTTEVPSAPSGPSEGPGGDRAPQSDTVLTYQDRPVLPSVLRVSGFGDDFMKNNTPLNDRFTSDRDGSNPASEAITSVQHLSPNGHSETEQSLQHQPSLGFRSVVNQAFDRPEDRSVPPTPSSMGGSGVARSNSESTTGVSPIMSRVPSAATAEAKARATGARDAASPPIAEEVNETSLTPTSSGILGTPMQLSQTPPSLHPAHRDSAEALPQAFRPGHRRDLSTPSPGNSPARSPAVEAIHGLPSAEQVEMASATPVDAKHVGTVDWPQASNTSRSSRIDFTTREADKATSINANSAKSVSNVADIASEAQSSFLESRRNNALGFQSQSRPESPIAKNESPTKGTVRNLADRFEAEGSSRRGSAASISSKAGMSSGIVRNGGDLTPPRPLADRAASFRPKLPGGWESYAPAGEVSTPGRELTGPDERLKKPTGRAENTAEPTASATTSTTTQDFDQQPDNDDFDITPTTVKRTLSMAQVESSADPFTAAAAAGSALAGAIAAAVGLEYNDSPSSNGSETKEEPHRTSNPEEFGAARGRSMSVKTGGPPLERSDTSLSNERRDSVSAVSNASPTPSPKDSPPVEHEPLQTSDNISSVVPQEQRIAEPAYTYERPVRPQMLPSLSTESGPLDYESDRLRKEIVRSLSPRTSRAISGNKPTTNMPDTDVHGLLAEPTSVGQFRESTILPQEYESYWNGSSDEDQVPNQSPDDRDEPEQTDEREASTGHQDQTASLPRKFSWEQDSQEGSAPEPAPVEYAHQQGDSQVSHDSPDVVGSPFTQAHFDQLPSRSAHENNNDKKALAESLRRFGEADVTEIQKRTEEDPDTSKEVFDAPPDRGATPVPPAVDTAFGEKATAEPPSNESPNDDNVPRYEGGLEVGRPSLEDHSSGSDRPSFVQSSIGHYASEPPSDQSGQLGVQDALGASSAVSGGMSGLFPSPVPASQPKIVTFREILTLKSPAERIRAYNNAREQFSNMDTGLNHWITTTIKSLPEHADLLSRGGKFDSASIGHRPSPSRGKVLRTSPTSATTQQPYYQQYLNASSQPAASSSGSTLPTPFASGSQGFSPSGPGGGARMASQQVQAKGKDLLHSAGLLGGKANHAAKGFFSKGKSKFRGSGGVDKDVPQTAPEKSQPQPQLDETPPPSLGPERQSRSSKSLSTGSRPLTVFDDPYRKRPFSTVLPDRPFSYAAYNDFDLPPSTSLGGEFRRLGVLPSPTVDATPMTYNDTKEATSDIAPQKAIGRDDLSLTSRNAARLEMLDPPAVGDGQAEDSSSPSSPVQPNPAVVGDVPVYLNTSASSQISTLSSEKGVEGTAAEEELETPKQSDFSRPIEHPSTFASTPPVPKTTQGILLESNEDPRESELQGHTSNGIPSNSSNIVAQQAGTTHQNSLPSVYQAEALPPLNHRQDESPYITNAEAAVSSAAARVGSNSLKSRSLDVSPERQYETVNHESELQQQSRTLPTQEREPQIEYRASDHGQSRRFSFVQYGANEPTVPSQDQVLREGQWESGYKNRQDPLQDGNSSFSIRPEWPTPGPPSSQQETSRAMRDENLRYSSTVPYRHQPLIPGSSYDSNILEHPAYHQEQRAAAQDLPSNLYPAETRREEGILPRHQSTEYQLTGIGPPQAERNPQKRRSSSRSSMFFKGLSRGSSSRTDVPKMPSVGGRTTSDQPGDSSQLSKRASKRASIFRSFTQRHDSESGRSIDSIVAQAPSSRTDLLQQSGPITPRPLQDTQPSERNPKESQSSSVRQRLRRRSTPGGVEPEAGKKKNRFSLKNLFARFGSTKRSPSPSPSPQAQLSPPPRPAQRPTLQPQQSSAYFAQSTQPYMPPPDRAVPQNQDPSQAPPIGGYYAPEIRARPKAKSSFVGGRRLSEQQVGEAKHRFESQTGFHGPYHGSSANSRTPDMRYQDMSVSAGPSAPQYASPSATAGRPDQHSSYGGGPGLTGVQQSTQPPSHYAQHPSYGQWSGQPAYTTTRPFEPPAHQVSPQVSRPDLQSQYSTPPISRPSATSTSQPIHPAQPSRPYTHNFSLHHRVDSPYRSREDSPQSRQRTDTSTPNTITTQRTARPPPPPPKSYTPPVPPKDDRLPFPPSQRPPASTSASPKPTSSLNPNLISQLSSRGVTASPQPSGTVDHGLSSLEVVGPQHQQKHDEQQQQRGRESKGAVGGVAEMDASNGRRGEEEEEEIVMSSTAYPGQEWAPSHYGNWEDD